MEGNHRYIARESYLGEEATEEGLKPSSHGYWGNIGLYLVIICCIFVRQALSYTE